MTQVLIIKILKRCLYVTSIKFKIYNTSTYDHKLIKFTIPSSFLLFSRGASTKINYSPSSPGPFLLIPVYSPFYYCLCKRLTSLSLLTPCRIILLPLS